MLYWLNPRQTSALTVHRDQFKTEQPEREFSVARTGKQKATWFFRTDKDLEHPEPKLTGRLAGDRLSVTAQAFVRDLAFFVERLEPDAEIDN